MTGEAGIRPAMWAIVPCKRLNRAKTRLAHVLGPAERHALARAMLRDVLAVLTQVRGLDGVAVVTSDPEVSALADASVALVLDDPPNADHSAAARAATAEVARRGVRGVLILSADVPLLTASEVERVLAIHGGGRGITIATNRAGEGTNAIACTPPDAIALSFGRDSRRRHVRAARELGLPVRCICPPGLALDIDTPEDLAEYKRRGGADGALASLNPRPEGALHEGAYVGVADGGAAR
jgi:2-phospho-L-lactate guanylyltransferase